MPSLRKRAGGTVTPAHTMEAAPVVDPPVPPADQALPTGVPGMTQAEAEGILADAQADVGAAMAQPAPPEADSDAAALKAQLEAMRRGEEARQLQQMQIQAAMSREGVPAPDASPEQQPQQQQPTFTAAEIALNQQYGIFSNGVLLNPALAQVATFASHELERQGFYRGTPEYENRFGPLFEQTLASARQQSAPPVTAPQPAAQTETPEAETEWRAPVSAPVSREIPSSLTGRPASESRVTLTADERDMARRLNIPEVEYARQVLKLRQLKAGGHYQERDG